MSTQISMSVSFGHHWCLALGCFVASHGLSWLHSVYILSPVVGDPRGSVEAGGRTQDVYEGRDHPGSSGFLMTLLEPTSSPGLEDPRPERDKFLQAFFPGNSPG